MKSQAPSIHGSEVTAGIFKVEGIIKLTKNIQASGNTSCIFFPICFATLFNLKV